MHKIESIKTGEKKYWKILVSLPRFELGAFGVVLQCTNHYTNHAIRIRVCKLRYFDNSVAEVFFKKRLVSQQRQHLLIK